jgi:integrase
MSLPCYYTLEEVAGTFRASPRTMKDQCERLIQSCAPHLRPPVVFPLETGARLFEALYLNWRHVDLAGAYVSFVPTTLRGIENDEVRGVPLHHWLVQELRHGRSMVFRTPAGLAYAKKDSGGGQIKTALNGACRRAGIVDFNSHDRRHTWATWRYAANRDLVALMKLGTGVDTVARDAAVTASLLFQHGCPVETLRRALTSNADGSASGPLVPALDLLKA